MEAITNIIKTDLKKDGFYKFRKNIICSIFNFL